MSTYVLKALHNVNNAKYYFDYLATQEKMGERSRVKDYVKKLDFIIEDILSRIADPEIRQEYRNQVKRVDSVAFESINDKLLYLTDEQRETVELMLDGIINGETIEVEIN